MTTSNSINNDSVEAVLAWLFRDITQLTKKSLVVSLSELGLFLGQPMILQRIHDKPGSTQKDIADFLHISGASLSSSITYLTKSNFVEQVQSKSDRRQNELYLTAEGEQVQKQCVDNLHHVYRKMIEGLEVEEVDILIKSLNKIRTNLRDTQAKTEGDFE